MSEREGPLVTIRRSCNGCAYERSESYVVQGGSGFHVSCVHPRIGRRNIGDTTWSTPQWCPFVEAGGEEREP